MKHDSYVRFVLTVIAACLVVLVVQSAIPPAHAAGNVTKVALCDAEGTRCVDVLSAQDGAKGIRIFTNSR